MDLCSFSKDRLRVSVFCRALTLLPVFFCVTALANPSSFFLPQDTVYDDAILEPVQSLGFEPGERHIRHDQLVAYLSQLADSSDRAEWRVIGHSYEERQLAELVISSPENLARLDAVLARQADLQAGNVDAARNQKIPLIVSLNYSVHGDEPSGSNAAPLVAYYLAAAQSPEVKRLLQDTIVILNPSLNPDGLSFFTNWVNNNRSEHAVSYGLDREHTAPWPYGRVNHYLFDLNRDWLFLRQRETQAAVASFRRWLPQVMGDFHEAGADTTAYFQPGVPKRTHPLTPGGNQQLTAELATAIAAGFDEHGLLYYTRERFDDFYHGKGATYSDLVGSVGLTFEVGGTRGLRRESRNGEVRFADTIRKQVVMSLELMDGARHLHERLQDYQLHYFESALEEASKEKDSFVLVGDAGDRARFRDFCEWLLRQGIEVFKTARSVKIGDREYAPGHAVVIPLRQPSYRMIRSLFERRQEFEEPIFYDISTWNAALAYDLPTKKLRAERKLTGARLSLPLPAVLSSDLPVSDYGYLLRWNSADAPKLLARLQAAGVQARVAMKSLSVDTHRGTQAFEPGSILMPVRVQSIESRELHDVLVDALTGAAVEAFAVEGGLAERGIDLGSGNFRVLESIRVAILSGAGVTRSEVGEIWHLLDSHVGMPLTVVDRRSLAALELDKFTHLILVEGNYGQLGKQANRIRRWVQAGGTLVLQRGATALAPVVAGTKPDPDSTEKSDNGSDGNVDADSVRPYAARGPDGRLAQIPGAIFELRIDRTHPLFFGFDDDRLPVMRRGRYVLPFGSDPYAHPAVYTEAPLLAGYANEENVERLKSTPAVSVTAIGRGRIVSLADDANFRGYFQGSSRLFLNVLFLGQIVR